MVKRIHLINPSNMKILKEYSSVEQALIATAQNAPESVFIGVEGNERAMFLDEFRELFSK